MEQGGYEKPPDLFVGDRFTGAYSNVQRNGRTTGEMARPE